MTSDPRRASANSVAWILALLGLLFVGGAVVLFAAGEDLFGSDSGTIDSYNQEVLESCALPPGSDLVQVSILRVADEQGQNYRSMWHVYASPLPDEDVARFFAVATGQSMLVSPEQACQLGQRPSVLVVPTSAAGGRAPATPQSGNAPVVGYDGLWANESAEVTMNAELPAGTQTLFRLRVAQGEVEGRF